MHRNELPNSSKPRLPRAWLLTLPLLLPAGCATPTPPAYSQPGLRLSKPDLPPIARQPSRPPECEPDCLTTLTPLLGSLQTLRERAASTLSAPLQQATPASSPTK